MEGKLPPHVRGHFYFALISYIQYQYFQCYVTEPLLLEQLVELDIQISSGQISRILIEGNDDFHAEKGEILSRALPSVLISMLVIQALVIKELGVFAPI